MKSRINSPGMWTAAMAIATALTAFSTASFAQDAEYVENVEELLDNVARYDGKKIRVSGEVEEIDERAFILESGGIFNDEIVVVIPERGVTVTERITEEEHATVTGMVHTISLVEVEREYGWDMHPEIEVELERVEAFLIAERIDAWEGEDGDSTNY